MSKRKIPASTIPRLSLYYRALLELKDDGLISSSELARHTHFTAAQVRRDLTYFGSFGRPGVGYKISELKNKLLKILGIDTRWNIALVGVGNLGSALISYKGFSKQGFNIAYAFDNDPLKVNKNRGGISVKHIKELERIIRKENIKIAIVTVPAYACQEVVNRLVNAGVRAILNFAPLRPQKPASTEILNVDLSIELEKLAYFLTQEKRRT